MSDESPEDRDRIWRRAEPDSPCKSICLIDPSSRLCIGCARTIEEISAWPKMSAESRSALRAELANREVGAPTRRGGRAGRVAKRKNSPKEC